MHGAASLRDPPSVATPHYHLNGRSRGQDRWPAAAVAVRHSSPRADGGVTRAALTQSRVLLPSAARHRRPAAEQLERGGIMRPVPVSLTLMTVVTLLTPLAPTDAGDAQLTPAELQRAARTLGAESRLLFGFPTGSAVTLTTSLITPIISEGPLSEYPPPSGRLVTSDQTYHQLAAVAFILNHASTFCDLLNTACDRLTNQ